MDCRAVCICSALAVEHQPVQIVMKKMGQTTVTTCVTENASSAIQYSLELVGDELRRRSENSIV